jgi:hypothetical protein
MSTDIDFQTPADAVHINDETMSLLTNEQLAYRIWNLLDSTVEIVGNPDEEGSRDHWGSNQQEAYCSALEGQICARVLARRIIGVEPRSIQEEQTRRLRLALGVNCDQTKPADIQQPTSRVLPEPPERRALMGVEYFDAFDDLTLACMAFNGTDVAQTSVLGADHQMSSQDFRDCIIPMKNSLTALRLLVLRMSGGSIESMADVVSRACRPNGETLQ